MGDSKELGEELHYDAFISYRHTQPDKFVAEHLHRELEKFKLPSNLERKMKKADPNAKTRIKRVFRDEEELPLASNLEDPIVEALKHSDFLIVICSPRLKESLWCRKEIETFADLHGTDRILTVLVEGEPGESFPSEILTRETEVQDENGNFVKIKQRIEPLAADCRADNDKGRLKLIKSEIVRLIAAMYGLNYDDIKQRHREQQTRRVVGIVSLVAVICLIFGVGSTLSAMLLSKQKAQIQEQADQIASQSMEILQQSQDLEEQYNELLTYQAKTLAQNSLDALGKDDRTAAIEYAYYAMTSYNGNEMPYTDEARYAMEKALVLYDISNTHRAKYTIDLGADLCFAKLSPDDKTLAVFDESNMFSFWELANGSVNCVIKDATQYGDTSEYQTTFVDDTTFLYSDGYGAIKSVNTNTGEISDFCTYNDGFWSNTQKVMYDETSELVYVVREKSVDVYNKDGGDSIKTYAFDDFIDAFTFKVYEDGSMSFLLNDYVSYTFVYVNNEGEIVYSRDDGDEYGYQDAYVYDGMIYILSMRRESDAVFSYKTYLEAIDLSTGKTVFERSDSNIYGRDLAMINEFDGPCIVEVGKNAIFEIDPYTGDMLFSDYYSDGITWFAAYDDSVDFVTADKLAMNLYGYTTSGSSSFFDCHLGDVDVALNTEYGFIFHEEFSDKLVMYSTISNPDIKIYDGQFTYKESEAYAYNYAVEKAQEIGLARPNYVSYIVYNDDGSEFLVSYSNGDVEIYKTKDMTVIATFEVEGAYEQIDTYLGKDKNGNEYWASGDYGYCVSPNGNLLSKIAKLIGIDADAECIYMGYKYEGADVYEAPIYTDEELIKIAENYLN